MLTTKEIGKDRGNSYRPGFLCCMMPVISPNAHGQLIDPGVQKLLSSLSQIRTKSGAKDDDVNFLQGYFKSEDFTSLLKVHQRMADLDDRELKPDTEKAASIAAEAADHLHCHPFSSESVELLKLLENPHMKALMSAHDLVAQKHYGPSLPDIPHEVDEDDHVSIKIVRLLKHNEPLGATLKILGSGAVLIARVMHGGAADRSGLIQAGDEVVEVNGVCKNSSDPQAFVNTLTSIAGPLTLKLVPADEVQKQQERESKMINIRTCCTYNATEDPLIPCKEAGLSFKTGEILRIVNQDDPLWWQARKELSSKVGLVPSRKLLEKRQAAAVKPLPKSGIHVFKGTKSKIPFKNGLFSRGSKRSKKNINCIQSEDVNEKVVVYEEVFRYIASERSPRVIILIGPTREGCNEIARHFVTTNPDRFESPLSYTNRPRHSTEVDGMDHNFLKKEDMEKEILKHKFLEYSKYRGYLYGTTHLQVETIMKQMKVCILNPRPQALQALRNADLKPYVIFIQPEYLETWSTVDASSRMTNTDFIETMADLEKYSHFYDTTVEFTDLGTTVEKLKSLAKMIEDEFQWVPIQWMF
ncbi:MAGUK p55 subfamily member 7-like isoform X2 [Tubulanus polymorphus]